MMKPEFLRLVFIAGFLFLARISAAGDEPTKATRGPATQDFAKMMKDSQEAMVPYKAKAIEAMLRAQLNVLSDPESSTAMARYVHNLYESLLKEGFTKEQALEIVVKLPLPSIPVTAN